MVWRPFGKIFWTRNRCLLQRNRSQSLAVRRAREHNNCPQLDRHRWQSLFGRSSCCLVHPQLSSSSRTGTRICKSFRKTAAANISSLITPIRRTRKSPVAVRIKILTEGLIVCRSAFDITFFSLRSWLHITVKK